MRRRDSRRRRQATKGCKSPVIVGFANKMARSMTAPEFAMWKLLRIQAHGAWLPQYPVNIDGAWVILDFYLKHARLAVEIDGPEHNRESDARRDARLLAVHGIRTVRFTNQQALGETWSCICSLCRAVNGK